MTLARRTVIAAAATARVSPARGAETASPARARLISAKWLIRAAVHGACWIPFITCAADSWRGPWRAIGDGARMALESWNTFSTHIPLLGQTNELPHAPRDLGPMQFWLLAIPVHADTDRGVLWGAALLVMLAASLTVEAAYSVLGAAGGLLAGGVVVATVAWFPAFAGFPYDNPNFGMMYFLAALSACLAVLSGHRNWWPVLVVTASIAAQAYLTFAAASVGFVLVAVVTGLADQVRAKGGYRWLIAGLVVGAACWIAPLGQQFASAGGQGNMSRLLHGNTGQHVGAAFAMKVMGSLAVPSPLWWRQDIDRRPDLFQALAAKPTAFGLVTIAVTAASLVIAVCWLRSRKLAGLAAISLLVSMTAAATFAVIPVRAITVSHDVPLVFVMFAAVLLAWLTVICVTVVAAVKLTSDRRGRAAAAGRRAPGRRLRARQHMIPLPVRGGAGLLIVTVLLGAARQAADYTGPGPDPLRVSAALAMIERSLPRQRVITLGVFAPHPDRYLVSSGLDWALTADGYHLDTTPSRRNRTITQVVIVIRKRKMTVHIKPGTSIARPQRPFRWLTTNPSTLPWRSR